MAAIKLTKQAARLWADPATRARIVAMHATETPLVDMVHELGLDDSLDADQLRGVVENLRARRWPRSARRSSTRRGPPTATVPPSRSIAGSTIRRPACG